MKTQEQEVRENLELAKNLIEKKAAKGVAPKPIQQRRYDAFKKAVELCEAGRLKWCDANVMYHDVESLEQIVAGK